MVFVAAIFGYNINMSIRIVRVQHDLQRALAQVFVRNNLAYVCIRNIGMSKDLRNATIEVSSLDATVDDSQMIKTLESRIGFIKKQLGSYIKMKYFPNIKFVLDAHKQRMSDLDKLMKQVEKELEKETEIIS